MVNKRNLVRPLSAVLFVTLLAGHGAYGQSLTLDDNPRAPAFSPLGFGLGAEDEFGLTAGPGLAPSPSLGALIFPADGTIFTPGIPSILEQTPNGPEIDAISTDHFPFVNPRLPNITIQFSVDRITTGAPGSAVAAEFGVGQQPGDIYTSSATFLNPAFFAGALGPGPFAGVLPSAGVGGTNGLLIDESLFGLVTAAGVVPPGIPAGPIVMGSHDNVDGFDFTPLVPIPGAGPPIGSYPVFSYFAVSPDEGVRAIVSAADIFDVAPFSLGTAPVPYALALALGLDSIGSNTDSVDALVVFDGGLGLGGPANSGPGAEPGLDYALFSLAPGSASLAPGVLTPLGLSAADIFFTDFSGAFAVFAFGTDVGLLPGAPGFPFQNQSNIDALEVTQIPEPASIALAVLATIVFCGYARRTRGLSLSP